MDSRAAGSLLLVLAVVACSCGSGDAPGGETGQDAATDGPTVGHPGSLGDEAGSNPCGPDAPYIDWLKARVIGSCGGLQQDGYPACYDYWQGGPKDWSAEEKAACASAGGIWSTSRCALTSLMCTGPQPVAACAVSTNIWVQVSTPPITPSDSGAPPPAPSPPDGRAICPSGWGYVAGG